MLERRCGRTGTARRILGTRRLGMALAVGLLTLAPISCADPPEPAPGALTPLTPPQAVRLAQALNQNHEAGGATFRVTAKDEVSGGTITLEGVVDWSRTQGRATVLGHTDERGPVVEVAWTADAVAELRPDLAAALLSRGESPDTFIVRPVDISRRPLDRLIAIVSGLATAQPDNAQLIIQNPGSGFVRSDTLRGVEVEVLRYGAQSIFWIDPTTGRLLRFEGTNSLGGAPIIVDVLELGRVPFELPVVTDLPIDPEG